MWLKQMVLDGFKSYATRTVISDWDPNFNAITGLNGSGKSNILDAICFVLGITNLSQVRVQNLQQLVYKEGQARVTRASVSLVFDNTDKDATPIGYEEYDEITVTRQVIIGGRNKYMINGQTAQLSRVRDLFHSIQLDVNNPHFLIMQGRITKVLNMKPVEILGMIQEAAGTKMYEEKKTVALKTLLKKQTKVDEINDMLETSITPQLERLRQEKTHYQEWSNNKLEIDKLEKLVIAFDYTRDMQFIQSSSEAVAALQEEKRELEAQKVVWKDQAEEHKNRVEQLTVARDQSEQGNLAQLEQDLNVIVKELAAEKQQVKNRMGSVKKEGKNLAGLEQSKVTAQEGLQQKQVESKEIEVEHEQIQEAHKAVSSKIASLEGQQLGIGMDDEKKDEGSLAQQLMEARRQVSEHTSTLKQTKNNLKNLTKQIRDLKQSASRADSNFKKLDRQRAKKLQQLEQLKAQLAELNVNEKEVAQMEQELAQQKDILYNLTQEMDNLRRIAAKVNFEYSDPRPRFDRRKVFGTVAQLIEVKDPIHTKAIEITAGGRLFNVVVDHHETAKDLLERGRLKRRVTIIPLNKITSRVIEPGKVNTAQRLVGRENCNVALELVGYADEVDQAMRHVFGSTFVCSDMTSAQKVAFDKRCGRKSVTYDGEVFDPQGTLTGGSSAQDSSLLEKLSEFRDKTTQHQELSDRTKQLDAQVRQSQQAVSEFSRLQAEIDVLEQEITVLDERMGDSAYAGMQNQIQDLQKQVEAATAKKEELENVIGEQRQKCNELEADMADYENRRERQLQESKKQLTKNKKELKKIDKQLKQVVQRRDRVTQEIEDMVAEIAQIDENVVSAQKRVQELEQELAELNQQMTRKQADHDALDARVQEEKAKISAQDREIKEAARQAKKCEKAVNEKELEIAKLDNQIKKSNERLASAKQQTRRALETHAFIERDKDEFGRPGSDYDFDARDVAEEKERLSQLREKQGELDKRINRKVMAMFERAETEYRDLIKKRGIVHADKNKIEAVIEDLDKKKEDTLRKTWKQVDKDFCDIFSTVLPGTICGLVPADEDNVMDGLEVRVGFGGVWKESLTELSGGQRSLLALSLILSLLRFKPAPMYILDEIDAALDLSHTQNIGQMLKEYFGKSQFIVVSLKEGMFSNANVLFRTKFVDGVSTVSRTAHVGGFR